MFLMVFLTLFLALAMGTFAGLLVAANTSFGSFSFSEPRKDLVRSITVGLVTAGVCIGLLALSRNARVLAALLPVWYITVKLCWLEMQGVDMVVVGFTSLAFVAAAVLVIVKIVR